jgi:hypothetical protein
MADMPNRRNRNLLPLRPGYPASESPARTLLNVTQGGG